MTFSPEQLAAWTDLAIQWGLLLAQALFVLFIGWIIANMFYSRVVAAIQARGYDMSLGRFLAQLARWSILGAAAIAAMGIVGIEVMGFVAVFASAGVAVGLALQGNLSNFASGVMILIFRPFDVGDVITAAGNTGGVVEIGLFSTTLHTPGNEKIIVPNSAVTGGVIINLTTLGTRRAAIPVGVAYGSDAVQVMQILKKAADGCDLVLAEPASAVGFTGLGASSVDFTVLVWCKSGDWVGVQGQVRHACYDALNEAGIEIPFNQIVVHQANG